MLISLTYYFSPTCFSNEFNMAMLLYFYFPFKKFYNILISQMVEKFGFWFCQMLICFARPVAVAEFARKPRETSYPDIKSTENQVLVCEKLNTMASYSQEESERWGYSLSLQYWKWGYRFFSSFSLLVEFMKYYIAQLSQNHARWELKKWNNRVFEADLRFQVSIPFFKKYTQLSYSSLS